MSYLDGDGMHMGWMFWGSLFFAALLLVGIVVLTVVLVRVLASSPRSADRSAEPIASAGDPGTGTARQILAERLARGEIDTDEYQARLRVLGDS